MSNTPKTEQQCDIQEYDLRAMCEEYELLFGDESEWDDEFPLIAEESAT